MAKRNVTLDVDGVEIGSELASNRTVTKQFNLGSKAESWPKDAEGKPVELRFEAIISLEGVSFQEILDDAIRTKVITLQNALRGTTKSPTPFEVLKELSKEPLRRHYNSCGTAPENPEKVVKNVMDAFSSLPPEMRKLVMQQMKAQQG